MILAYSPCPAYNIFFGHRRRNREKHLAINGAIGIEASTQASNSHRYSNTLKTYDRQRNKVQLHPTYNPPPSPRMLHPPPHYLPLHTLDTKPAMSAPTNTPPSAPPPSTTKTNHLEELELYDKIIEEKTYLLQKDHIEKRMQNCTLRREKLEQQLEKLKGGEGRGEDRRREAEMIQWKIDMEVECMEMWRSKLRGLGQEHSVKFKKEDLGEGLDERCGKKEGGDMREEKGKEETAGAVDEGNGKDGGKIHGNYGGEQD